MLAKLKPVLPLLMVAAFVVFWGSAILILCDLHRTYTAHAGETKVPVEATVGRLRALHPADINAPAFRKAVSNAARAPHVAAIWVYTPEGKPLYGKGCILRQAVQNPRGTQPTRELLDSLPSGMLDSRQRGALLTVASLQAEGEHKNIYHYMVRTALSPTGEVIGLIGVVYEKNSVPVPSRDVALAFAMIVAAFIYKLSLITWVFMDARQRGERAWVWTAFALIGDIVALIAYLLVRSPRPAPKEQTI